VQTETNATTTRGKGTPTVLPEGWKFPGFSSPNTTQIPDEFFDQVMPFLGHGELKVVLYIMRRTFGFKKEADNISLSQMVKGIRKKDGEQLDHGTGLSKDVIVNAVRLLVEKNIIIAEKRKGRNGGNLATTYSLNLKGTPPSRENRPGGSGKSTTPLVGKTDPQQTVYKQHTVRTTTTPQAKTQAERHDTLTASVVASSSTREKKDTIPPSLPATTQGPERESVEDSLTRLLVKIGVSRAVAASLTAKYPHDFIRDQVRALPYRKASEPAAVLVKSIREEWELPKQCKKAAATVEKQAREIVKKKQEELQERQAEQELGRLSPEEREALRCEAEERIKKEGPFFAGRSMSPAIADGYMRMILSERLGFSDEEGADASAKVSAVARVWKA
jgi:hypothetical protein